MTGQLVGGAPAEDAESDAALWGITLPAARRDDHDGIWPCNLSALRAFLAVSTQWRAVERSEGQLRWIGLDYAGARAGLDLAGIAVTPDLWADVQTIETAARAALNERR